jgi:hypothetical protein
VTSLDGFGLVRSASKSLKTTETNTRGGDFVLSSCSAFKDNNGMNGREEQKSEFLQKLDILVSEAIADAVARDRKLGAPIYILRDGKVVDISQEPVVKTEKD